MGLSIAGLKRCKSFCAMGLCVIFLLGSMQIAVLCGCVPVLNNFKKLLLRLEQCRMHEQQQIMSDEPGR